MASRRLLAALIAVLFVSACSSSKKERTNEKRVHAYYSLGTSHLAKKQYSKALKYLLKASRLSPEDDKIQNNLGMAYYFKKRKNLAAKHLIRALKLNKENSDARNNLASIYFENGQLDLAKKQYKIILNDLVYQKQFRTHYNLALIELKQGNQEQALAHLKTSLEDNPDYCPSHFKVGAIAFDHQQYQSALESFKLAGHGTCYEDPAPQYHQALTLIKLKKYRRASSKLEDVMGRFSKSRYSLMAQMKLKEVNRLMQTDDTELSENEVYYTPQF